mgnify:CR=1 FL=1
MAVTIKRWGNSLALRIPKDLADDLEVSSGTRVEFGQVKTRRVKGHEGSKVREVVLRIGPDRKRPKVTLARLMAQYKPEHRHGEWDLGKAMGNEVW